MVSDAAYLSHALFLQYFTSPATLPWPAAAQLKFDPRANFLERRTSVQGSVAVYPLIAKKQIVLSIMASWFRG